MSEVTRYAESLTGATCGLCGEQIVPDYPAQPDTYVHRDTGSEDCKPDTAAATLPEPVKRYTRIVDRLECPICGKRLGERSWDHRTRDWSMIAYVDSGPTYYRDTVIGPKIRTFKPCGCEAMEFIHDA